MMWKILQLLVVAVPLFAQTPCDKAIIKNSAEHDISECLLEMVHSLPETPVFTLGSPEYGFEPYYGSSFGGHFNFDDLINQSQYSPPDPSRYQVAVEAIRTALRSSPTDRIILLQHYTTWGSVRPSDARETIASSIYQLKTYYPLIYAHLWQPRQTDDVPTYRAKVYNAYAELITCPDCQACYRLMHMEPSAALSNALPKSGIENWLAWRHVKIESDVRQCAADVHSGSSGESRNFQRSLLRLLDKSSEDNSPSVKRSEVALSKVYEAEAESNICGDCADPCKRFLLMEPTPEILAASGGLAAWKTWRQSKVGDDRKACVLDIKGHHPEVWEQLNLLERNHGDISGERLKTLVEDAGSAYTEVSWKPSAPWLDVRSGAMIWRFLALSILVAGASIVYVVKFSDTPSSSFVVQGTEPLSVNNSEADIVMSVPEDTVKYIRSTFEGELSMNSGLLKGQNVESSLPLFYIKSNLGHASINAPVSGVLREVSSSRREVTIRTNRLNEKLYPRLLGKNAFAPLAELVGQLANQLAKQRRRALGMTIGSLGLGVAVLCIAGMIAYEFCFFKTVGIRYSRKSIEDAATLLVLGLAASLGAAKWAASKMDNVREWRLRHMVNASCLSVRVVDHRKEFLAYMERNSEALRALKLLDLSLSGWSMAQVLFRCRHLMSLAYLGEVGMDNGYTNRNPSASRIDAAYRTLYMVSRAHPFVFVKDASPPPSEALESVPRILRVQHSVSYPRIVGYGYSVGYDLVGPIGVDLL